MRLFQIFILSLLVFSQTSRAQNIQVQGRTLSIEAVPLEYVEVTCTSEDSSTYGTFSDSTGAFLLKVPKGSYLLKTKTWGYDEFRKQITVDADFDVGELLLELSSDVTGLEITARKPRIIREIDRIRISVENTILSDGDMWDMLLMAPGILADSYGNLSIYGKSGILVMIDGRPVNLSGEDLKDFLSGLSAGDVASLEVISNPPASMDASGAGVINIRLKKSKTDGYNGSVRNQYARGVFGKNKLGLSGMYKRKKWFVQGNYDFSQRRDYVQERNSIRFFENSGSFSDWEENLKRTKRAQGHSYYAFASYDITPKSSLNFRTSGRFNPWTNVRTDTRTGIGTETAQADSSILNAADLKQQSTYFDAYVGFSHDLPKTALSVDFDYTLLGKEQAQKVDSDYLSSAGSYTRSEQFLQDATQNLHILGGRLDLSSQLKGGLRWDYGGKASLVNTSNATVHQDLQAGDWVRDTLLSNQFSYQEITGALYTSLTGKWKNWGWQVGLRGEQTTLTGEAENEGKILESRAPETRKVLARIDGWALNWASTLLGVVFLLAIWAATTVRFEFKETFAAEVTSAGNFQLLTPIDVATQEEMTFQWKGKQYLVMVQGGAQLTQLTPLAPLPTQLKGEIVLSRPTEVSLLKAIFSGLI